MNAISIPEFPTICAVIGRTGTLPGAAWRHGDPLKHLGPPMDIHLWSQLWQTRCGLTAADGNWDRCNDEDDLWCPPCLRQAGIAHREEPI